MGLPTIWMDIQSPAEGYWFWPLYKKLEAMDGVRVLVTSRDHGEVLSTLAGLGIPSIRVLSHPGGSYIRKAIHLGLRVKKLVSEVRSAGKRDDLRIVAHISHSPYGQVAARMMGINGIYLMDDPHAHLATRLSLNAASVLLYSSYIPEDTIPTGGRAEKHTFKGIVEADYVRKFLTREVKLGLPAPAGRDDRKRIILRPSPTHSEIKHSKMIWAVARKLSDLDDVEVLVIPRYRQQMLRWSGTIRKLKGDLKLYWDLGGLPLVDSADVTITGGATMAREAALLGRQGISCYPDPLGGDDYFTGRPFHFHRSTNSAKILSIIRNMECGERGTDVASVSRSVFGGSWTELALELLAGYDPAFGEKHSNKKETPQDVGAGERGAVVMDNKTRARLLEKMADPASRISASLPGNIEYLGRKVRLRSSLKQMLHWKEPTTKQTRTALEQRAWLAEIVEQNKKRIASDTQLHAPEAEELAQQAVGILRAIEVIDGVLSGKRETGGGADRSRDMERWLDYTGRIR